MGESINRFFAAWTVQDRGNRQTTLASAMDAQFSYADPRTADPITQLDALTDYVGMFSEQAPGAAVEVIHEATQADITRATVAFRMADGMQQLGQYFVEHSDNGLITRMVGFVGTGAET